MTNSPEKNLTAQDFLEGVPPELRKMLEQIDIENEHDHEHDEHHVHGPGCNH